MGLASGTVQAPLKEADDPLFQLSRGAFGVAVVEVNREHTVGRWIGVSRCCCRRQYDRIEGVTELFGEIVEALRWNEGVAFEAQRQQLFSVGGQALPGATDFIG